MKILKPTNTYSFRYLQGRYFFINKCRQFYPLASIGSGTELENQEKE